MIRDHLKSREYFDHWLYFYLNDIEHKREFLNGKFEDEGYRPQYAYEIARNYQSVLFHLYSRGDPIRELNQYFPPLLDAWEESERLGTNIWTEQQQYTRHAWAVNLDHYIDCFWLVGLALSLRIPDDQWWRLLALIGNEGEDELLDQVIASRQLGRKIGSKLCHPKPYQRLLNTINAPKDQQAKLLLTFVDKWYAELNRPPRKSLSEQTAMYARPYWYKYHTLEGGYFGYWCVEAVAAVSAFSLDDSLCLGHSNYPGDLLRPDNPSTHSAKESDTQTAIQIKPTITKLGLLPRLFGRRR